jgi:hypothetical protein
LQLQTATEEATQSALCLQSTVVDVICSVIARYFPHSTLNILHAETTNSGSQVQAVENKFSRKCVIVEQTACQVADGAHKNVPADSSTNIDTETDSILTFTYTIRIRLIPCPHMTVVDFEHISRPKHASSRYRTLCQMSSIEGRCRSNV